MANIKSELHTRALKKKVFSDKYEIVGVEIKNRRKRDSKTLEYISQNVCSQSYLCKIEKNKIDPNKNFLREICSRLELTDDKVDFLFELRDVLLKVVGSFIIGDYSYIEYAYLQGKGFENYRFNIIKLIYHISLKEIDSANVVCNELLPIISNMGDFDLSIFAVFSAILSYYKYDFKNALDDLEYIDDITTNIEIRVLKKLVEFKVHFAMNSYDTPTYYENVKKEIFDCEYYGLIKELNYLMGLYYIKNDCDKSFKKILNKMMSKKDLTSLKAVKAFMDDNFTNVCIYEDSDLNDFALSLKMICSGNNKSKEIFNNNAKNYYQITYDIFFIEYYLIKTYKEKFNYIFEKGLPMACKANDMFLCNFFYDELTKMPKINKTRALLKAYAMIHGLPFNGDLEGLLYEE